MSDAGYEPYVVEQGDYLMQLAVRYGFEAEVVWQHPDNAALAKTRDPNILAPGDVIYFPRTAKKWFTPKVGEKNVYTAKPTMTTVSLRFTDANGPMTGAAYRVEGASIAPGNLSDDGVFSANVSTHVREFVIVLPHLRHVVRIAHLDPISTMTGIAQRLKNLGFLTATMALMHGHEAEEAVYAAIVSFRTSKEISALRAPGTSRSDTDPHFQEVQRRDPTGLLTNDTLEALLSAHGS